MRTAHRTLGPAILRGLGVDVRDRERVPGAGGVLLAANHRAWLDHFVLGSACPRPMRFLGKTSLARGLGGRFNLAMGMIPLERGGADRVALTHVVECLRAGQVVGMFPEGTRSPTGHLYRFRSGLARVAQAAGVPVVPVGLVGTAEAWPSGRPLPRRRGAIVVRFGPLLPPPAPGPEGRRDLTAAVHAAVARLCGQPLSDRFAPAAADEPVPGRA